MLQGFEWYCPSDGSHWQRLARAMPRLKSIGIDNIWIPPGCKAGWKGSNGYDLYDLYDLGEFDQKGSRETKWGSREDLTTMMNVARAVGMGIYWDAVLNHKAAADYTETCQAVRVSNEDRTKEIDEAREVEVWTGYEFAGRNGQYSTMKYHWHHFSGTNYDVRQQTDAIYKFVGPNKPGWAEDVDDENGNADYLMCNDLDFSQIEVRNDICYWGEWIATTIGLSGFRMDAVKHFSTDFLKTWVEDLDQSLRRKLFIVGEYWSGDSDLLCDLIKKFDGRIHLFDVALAYNFSAISRDPSFDLRRILQGTLIEQCPDHAVTFVRNHDTQHRVERDHEVAPVESWFVPLAYAFILLRANSGYPCAFYGDLYGTTGLEPQPPTCYEKLQVLLKARKLYAYGSQNDYLDQSNCIGFTRVGSATFSNGAGLAVVISTSYSFCLKRMNVGENHTGEVWSDILRFAWGSVVIDHEGWGIFPVGPCSAGVWVNSGAQNRAEVDELKFDSDIYNPSPGPIVVT